MPRALLLLALGGACTKSPAAPEKPLVGGLGKRLLAGPVGDLRLSRNGAWATVLRNPKRPPLEGVPRSMAAGELTLVSLQSGVVRALGPGVANRPGGSLFTADGRWVLFVEGYNAVSDSGTLRTARVDDPGPAELRGKAVSYVTVSPDGGRFAFVDGGVLRLARLAPGSTARTVAGEISTAQFSPDGRVLAVKRRTGAGGALLLASVEGGAAPLKVADKVSDYVFAPSGGRLAFTAASGPDRDVVELFTVGQDGREPRRRASAAGAFAFSPDGAWLARVDGEKPGVQGALVVGPAAGGPGHTVAEKVGPFWWGEDGRSVAVLGSFNLQQHRGTLVRADAPGWTPRTLGRRVHEAAWGRGGALAYNVEEAQPLPSIDLWLAPPGAAPLKLLANVYGFGFSPLGTLLFRADCTRLGAQATSRGIQEFQARSCNLDALDPSRPREQIKPLLEGIYSWKVSDSGERILVSYARTDGDAYDTAVFNVRTGERKTLDERTLIPALFADREGKRVVYLIADRDRSGLYLSDQGP